MMLPKIVLAQMEVVPGQPWVNLAKAIQLLRQAEQGGAELVVFPELCIPGYLIGDLWEEVSFVRDCIAAGDELVAATGDCAVVFGNVAAVPGTVGEDGRMRRYNAAILARHGKPMGCMRSGLPFFAKTLLPNYREFDESRYFHDLRKLALERQVTVQSLSGPVEMVLGGSIRKVGITLCEDGWSDDYGIHPVLELAAQGADLVLNLSASPYTRGKDGKRQRVFAHRARTGRVALYYTNCIGMQNNGKTIFGFDGGSMVHGPDGEILATAGSWKEGLLWSGTSAGKGFEQLHSNSTKEFTLLPSVLIHNDPESLVFDAKDFVSLVQVVKRFLERSRLERIVVGVSGGIDSAVAAALFCHVVGPENVLAVSMPGPFTSATTRGLAADLASNLTCWFAEIPILDSVEITRQQLDGLTLTRGKGIEEHELHINLSEFTMENVQARDRSSRILATLAAAFGGGFTCNANKAELTVGYSTLYGDQGGFLAPLADLWKGEVYALGRLLNQVMGPCIPEGVFTIKPSAELNAAQNPEQGGGDPLIYWYHDRLFQSWMQDWNRKSPEEILEWFLNGELDEKLQLPKPISSLFSDSVSFIADLERWWNLFKGMGVVKRIQAPPVVALSRRAYGFDYRESLLQPHFSKKYQELRQRAIAEFDTPRL